MSAKYTVLLKDIMEDEKAGKVLRDKAVRFPLYMGGGVIQTREWPPKMRYRPNYLFPDHGELLEKLLNHWKYHEIGFETIGRFIDELSITLNEIMPRYNELLRTVDIMCGIEDPFGNVDIVETFEQTREDRSTAQGNTSSNQTASGKTDTTNDSTSTSTGKEDSTASSTGSKTGYGKEIKVDTPQDSLSIGAKGINNLDYASEGTWNNATDDETSTTEGTTERTSSDTNKTTASTENESTASETGNSSSTSESSGTTKHTYTKKGNQGVNTYAHDMIEFRESIIDVVEQIINDPRIGELFMMIY